MSSPFFRGNKMIGHVALRDCWRPRGDRFSRGRASCRSTAHEAREPGDTTPPQPHPADVGIDRTRRLLIPSESPFSECTVVSHSRTSCPGRFSPRCMASIHSRSRSASRLDAATLRRRHHRQRGSRASAGSVGWRGTRLHQQCPRPQSGEAEPCASYRRLRGRDRPSTFHH
jgi:hypothetical protein